MADDPGQTKNVAREHPEAAARLTEAAAAWRIYGPDEEAKLEKGGASTRASWASATQSFPSPCCPRAASRAAACGRSGKAPNCSYFMNWVDKTGEMAWAIDVQTTGEYDVTVDYTCPLADVGSLVELSFNGSRLTGKVTSGWDPPLNTNQDTVPSACTASRR